MYRACGRLLITNLWYTVISKQNQSGIMNVKCVLISNWHYTVIIRDRYRVKKTHLENVD